MRYAEWLESKAQSVAGVGIRPRRLLPHLFEYQSDLVRRALSVGRFALFCDTGTGKTAMQLEWSRVVSQRAGRVLILAPLAVAEQTAREAKRFGTPCRCLREDDDTSPVVITNYEMLHHFPADRFAGIVLDESSILKDYTGKFRNTIIESFAKTPYRLACTATPAPNDHMELGNHAEFLGWKTRSEMLAEYFVHDGGSTQSWRLKGHARDAFWRWVCSWAAVMARPSDLGYSDDGFAIPDMHVHEHVIAVDHADMRPEGYLFAPQATTLSDQRAVRRATMDDRVSAVADLAAERDPVVVWCELNAESEAVTAAIDGAVEVRGSDTFERKREALLGFADGTYRVLVTKPKIAGHGLNWQHCSNVIFVGVSHSFEQTYQAIRRCWRYGQKREVHVHFIRAETEDAIIENYRRKETDHRAMIAQMLEHHRDAIGGRRWVEYEPKQKMTIPEWL